MLKNAYRAKLLRYCYQAERLKNRRRPVWKLMIVMPVVLSLFSALLAREYFIVDNYNWWYSVVFPAFGALICAEIGDTDKRIGNRNVLTLPVNPKRIWDAKILWGVRMSAVSMLFICVLTLFWSAVFKYGLHMEFIIEVGIRRQIGAWVILFVTFLWQVPFCMILGQFVGAPVMLLIHMVFYVIAFAELSLTPYFFMLPGGIPARMMCIVLRILPNGLPAREGMVTFRPELLSRGDLIPGILGSLVWFFLLCGISRKLYERQVTGR